MNTMVRVVHVHTGESKLPEMELPVINTIAKLKMKKISASIGMCILKENALEQVNLSSVILRDHPRYTQQ
jgi:hypothetical protein